MFQRLRSSIFLILVAAFVLLLGRGTAGTGVSGAPESVSAGPGVAAFVDGAGNLVAPPVDAVWPAVSQPKAFSRFTYRRLPGGVVVGDLNGAWMVSMEASVGEDGAVQMGCAHPCTAPHVHTAAREDANHE